MKKLISLLVLLPALAMAQGLSNNLPWAGSGKVLANFPLTWTGGVIETDANTVSHVIFNPAVTNYALQSNSASSGSSPVSPWTIANSATVTTTATSAGDPFTGSWTTIDTSASNVGSLYQAITAPSATLWTASAWVRTVSGSGTCSVWTLLNGFGSCTCARSDGGACTVEYPSGFYCQAKITDCTTTPVRLWATATSPASTSPYILISPGNYGGTTGTVMFGGAQVELGVIRPSDLVVTTTAAVTVRPVNTNYALQSNNLSSGASPVSPWTNFNTTVTTPEAAAAAQGGGYWTRVVSTNTANGLYQTQTVPSSVTFTGSAWLRNASGTPQASVFVDCKSGTPTCACARNDGGSCSAASAGSGCFASVTDLGATPVRLAVTATCNAAKTSLDFLLVSGIYSVSTGTVDFTGAQLEAGTVASDLIPTLGTAVQMDRALVDTFTRVPVNYALQSNSLSSGSSAVSPWALTNATVTTVDGAPIGGTWAEVTSSVDDGRIGQIMTTPPATAFVGSYWVVKGSGSGVTTSMLNTVNAPTSCTCTRSDGAACTSTIVSVYCETKITATTTPVRVTVMGSGGAATTNPWLMLYPGERAVGTGTARFGGVQLEVGSREAAPLIVTTTAAASGPAISTSNLWAMTGTVPQVQATPSPFMTPKPGAGPFANGTVYYSLPAGSPLHFTGEFTACFVLSSTLAAYVVPLGNKTGNNGWEVYFDPLPATVLTLMTGTGSGQVGVQTGNLAQAGGPIVACVGRAGTTIYSKSNLGTTATAASSALTASASPVRLGNRQDGSLYFPGTLYEFYATTTPWNEATVTAIQQKVLGHLDGTSPLTVTRASLGTYIPRAADGQLYTSANNVARITESGLLVEPQRTNKALYSNTMRTNYTTSNAHDADGGASPLGGNWDEVISDTIDGFAYRAADAGNAPTEFVMSVWMRKASGTGYAAIDSRCGEVPATCSCLRSDGGSCTATKGKGSSVNSCFAEVSDLGTTPIRLSAVYTCTNPVLTTYLVVFPGQLGVATGTTRFSGIQFEWYANEPTSLINTDSGTATLRLGDVATATIPAVPGKFCVAESYKFTSPNGYTAGGYPARWGIGSGPNAMRGLTMPDGTPYSGSVDGSGSPSWYIGTAGGGPAARIVECFNRLALTAPLVTSNGAPISLFGPYGAGNGVVLSPATILNFGYHTASYILNGYIKDVKICSGGKPGGCK